MAGLAMGAFGMIQSLLSGKGLMNPLRLIGFTFQPFFEAPEKNKGIIAVGLLIHVAMSMIAGVVFILFVNMLNTARKLLWIWGPLYATFIWLFLQFGILRMLNPEMAAQINQPVFLLSHLVFGTVIGGYVASQLHKNDMNKM